MIKSICATNYLGDSITLELTEPEKSGFVVMYVDGLGPVKGVINTTEISTNDGSLYNSAKLSERNIVIGLLFCEESNYSIEELRHLSYKYFPMKKPVNLSIKTDTRECEITGYVESNEPNIFSEKEGTVISIICPDPYFYSSGEEGNTTVVFSGIEPLFEFPFSNESLEENLIEFSEIKNLSENYIYYDGDSEIGVTITVHALGPVSNISIYNSGTREIMRIDTDKLAALTGEGMVAGDDIIICTVKGHKRVTLRRKGQDTNILNCLDRDSDWFQLSKGDNIFAYSAESGSNNLQFQVEHKIIYEGV